MSSDYNDDYVADFLLGTYADNRNLETAVEHGARSAISGIINMILRKAFPKFSGYERVTKGVIDFIFNLFGW